jgi:hypothetical protein
MRFYRFKVVCKLNSCGTKACYFSKITPCAKFPNVLARGN